jgi:hypothetical protein
MPGVVVTTAVRTGPSTINVAPASTFFVAGTAERGATGEAKLVTSLADFEVRYGGYTADGTLHQQVQTFFEEGGAKAYVGRVVGDDPATASLTLTKVGGGNAFTVTAANSGAWANGATDGLSVTTTDGPGTTSNFKLYLGEDVIYQTGALTTAADFVAAINNSAVATIYISASVNTASATLGASAGLQLSGGADGDLPTEAQLVAGLELFETNLGAGAVAIPGSYSNAESSIIWDGLLAHAIDKNRIALLAFAEGNTVAETVTEAEDWIGTQANTEYAGFYYPSITMTGSAGTSLTISPEGYVAAKRSIAHNSVGAWQAAAGLNSKATFVTGVETSIDKADGDTLDEGYINAIRIIQGSVRVYGARSASTDTTNFRYLTARDTLNYIVTEAEKSLEDLVFSTIDGRRTVFGRVEARLIGLLDPLRTAGGLYEAFDSDGNQIDTGYSVEVTDALNPVSQLATGTVKAKVGVRVSSVADRIEVEIVKSNLTASVV